MGDILSEEIAERITEQHESAHRDTLRDWADRVADLESEVARLWEALATLDQACEDELGGFYLSDPGRLGEARDKARAARRVKEAKPPLRQR